MELYGGGRISEGNAAVMELGHSRDHVLEVPIPGKGKSITEQHQTEDSPNPENAAKLTSSGSGDGIEIFKYGDEDLVSQKPLILELPEISTQPG